MIPLRVGGDTRLKIFEAMTMEKTIVSTHIGAEGLPIQDRDELLLADGPPRSLSRWSAFCGTTPGHGGSVKPRRRGCAGIPDELPSGNSLRNSANGWRREMFRRPP